ncbi:hypothetical protein GQ44DRAFT_770251 [Phaeosphaeriaceae sp. PMI808]|nr:hypothetical protein GQ44DRAFT_770251 [Phaeosphaeriaceae sp. PMI808]
MYWVQILHLVALAAAVPAIDDASGLHTNITIQGLLETAGFNFSTIISQHDDRSCKHSNHEKRAPPPATDQVWELSKCKGRKFMAQMGYSDFDAGRMLPVPQTTIASPWQYGHTGSWGWEMAGVSHGYRNFNSGDYWGVGDFLKHIGFSDKCVEEGGTWNAIGFTHYEPGIPIEEQRYYDPLDYGRKATGGHYYLAVNEQGGMLLQNLLSPREGAYDNYPEGFDDAELPALGRASNLMWATWEYHVPEEKRANINIFMALQVVNPTARSLLDRALGGERLTPSPIRFGSDSDAGLALLGSPLGTCTAHFIIQRKQQIGLKRIPAVWAMQSLSRTSSPVLMFQAEHLTEAVPLPKPEHGMDNSNDLDADSNTPSPSQGMSEKAQDTDYKNILRVHTFQGDGSMTVENRFM